MKKLLALSTSLMALASLGACATEGPPTAKVAPNEIGGSYLVAHFPGLPSVGDRPAVAADPWGPTQFRQVQYLDEQCHKQMDPYIPSVASDIAHLAIPMALEAAAGGAIGTGLGAVKAFTGVSFSQYATYAGFSAGGSGLGSGIAAAGNQWHVAKSYVQYACLHGFVSRAAQKGELRGVQIIPWAGAGFARKMQLPHEQVAVAPVSNGGESQTAPYAEPDDRRPVQQASSDPAKSEEPPAEEPLPPN